MIGAEEKEAILKLTPFFNECPIVFDVGSNKGSFTDVMLEEFAEECSLYLFEPNYKLLSYCEIKYEYNKNIIYNNSGVYRFSGVLDFFYFENENNELSSLVESDEWAGLPKKQKPINVTTIDQYCIENEVKNIDCLKIDVEGVEPDVLFGAKQMLSDGAIRFIIIEYSPHYKRAKNKFSDVLALCHSKGYSCYYYHLDNYWLVDKDTFIEDYRFENFVITKENIRDYSTGWNKEFIINTFTLGKFELVLEVGCFEGLTTKYICDNLLEQGGRVVCVDPLEDCYTKEDTEHKEMFAGQYYRFLRNTRGRSVNLIRKTSREALPELHELRFNFIYIDADHSRQAVYWDGVYSFKILKVGGYMLFDDYGWREETKTGIDAFLKEYAGRIDVITQEYQVLIQKKSN